MVRGHGWYLFSSPCPGKLSSGVGSNGFYKASGVQGCAKLRQESIPQPGQELLRGYWGF